MCVSNGLIFVQLTGHDFLLDQMLQDLAHLSLIELNPTKEIMKMAYKALKALTRYTLRRITG